MSTNVIKLVNVSGVNLFRASHWLRHCPLTIIFVVVYRRGLALKAFNMSLFMPGVSK